MLTEFHEAIPDADLAEGVMKGVSIGGASVLLARVNGCVHAINDICSHFHTHLSNGELLVETCQVQCPLHDSLFDLRTGEPDDPPAEDPVEVYAVRIEGGMISVGPKG